MPVPQPKNSPLHVVIVGGGLGGLALAVALGKAGIKVDLFEQLPAFAQVGAGIHLGPNTIRALRLQGLGEEYDAAGETEEGGGLFFEWWDGRTDKKHGETFTKYPRSSCHRARLLEALLRGMPSNVQAHFSTRVNGVENVGNKARLRFTASRKGVQGGEGPSEEGFIDADVIVGADGVKSVIRTALQLPSPKHAFPSLEGKELPPASYRYTGTYCYRGLVPMDKVKAIEPEDQAVPNSAAVDRMWFAKDSHILTFPIEHGTVLNVVAFISDRSKPKDQRTFEGPWVKPVSHEKLMDDFKQYHDHPKRLLELFDDFGHQQWALHEVLSPLTWRKGRITLLGDSAHASLPHNGAGAGQAIEDSYVLTRLLSHPACTPDNVEEFLQAYEDVRKPRTSAQQLHSIETGEMYEFASPLGDDMEALSKEMLTRQDWIWDYDIAENAEDAFRLLRERGVVV